MLALAIPRLCAGALLLYLAITPSFAQTTDANLEEALRSAYAANDADRLERLISTHRLGVKPVVHDLISRYVRSRLDGRSDEAEALRETAEALAHRFERVYGEKSLVEAVSNLSEWAPEDLGLKWEADSLHAAAAAQRAHAESRQEALSNYMEALALYRSIGDHVGEASVLGGVGFVYWYLGEPDSVLAYFEAGMRARRAVDDRVLLGNSLHDMGLAHLALLRDYEAALAFYLDAIEVYEAIGDSSGWAKSLLHVGETFYLRGMLSDARPYYLRAAQVAGAIGEAERHASSTYLAGRVLSDLGRYSEALPELQRALELYRARADLAGAAKVLNMIGATYRRIGDYDAALERYREVVALAEQEGDSIGLAYALLNTGIVLNYAERFSQAIPRFEQAQPIFVQEGNTQGDIWTVTGLSNAYFGLKDYAKAEAYGRQALRWSREAQDETEECRALITLANAQVRAGKHGAAFTHYQEALERTRALDDPELGWAVRMGLGEYHETLGAYEDAIQFYAQALEVVETVRGHLQTEQDRSGFFAERRFAYENIIHLYGLLHETAPDSGYDAQAFEWAERGKARSFLDRLSATPLNGSLVAEDLRLREEELHAAIGQARRTLQIEMARQVPDRAEVGRLENALNRLEEEYQNLQRDRNIATSDWSGSRKAAVAGADEVQSELIENEVLLQYAVGDSSSSLWVVTRDSVRMYGLPDRRTLEERVEVLRFALSSPEETALEAYVESARALYDLLIEPAARYVESGYHLTIVPDGVLHYLPFEALLLEAPAARSPADFEYLVERSPVSYAPSASVLLLLKTERYERESPFDKQLVAFGDPDFGDSDDGERVDAGSSAGSAVRFGLGRLPHSGVEVRTISALFPSSEGDVFVRADAAEERVKAGLKNYRFVHFATHGIVDEQRPDFSGLVLAQNPTAKEDGFLQASEILNMEIDAELAVLSACETGLGKMVRGEGLVGLTRAFMYAGVPSIVVSLWRVADESTSRLMERFYSAMVEGEMDAADALRHAKLDMIRTETHGHPFHWAPFIMIGKTD